MEISTIIITSILVFGLIGFIYLIIKSGHEPTKDGGDVNVQITKNEKPEISKVRKQTSKISNQPKVEKTVVVESKNTKRRKPNK